MRDAFDGLVAISHLLWRRQMRQLRIEKESRSLVVPVASTDQQVSKAGGDAQRVGEAVGRSGGGSGRRTSRQTTAASRFWGRGLLPGDLVPPKTRRSIISVSGLAM